MFNATAKQVTADIRKIDGKKLRGDIQTAVINVIGHAMAHGSSPLVEALMDRMNASPMMKKVAPMVSAYVLKHGPFAYSKETGWKFAKKRRDALIADGYDFDALQADAPMWDDVPKAPKETVVFDVFKEVEKLIAKADHKATSGEAMSAELIPYLKAVLGKFVGDQVMAKAKADADAAQAKAKADEEELRRLVQDAIPETV